MNETKIKIHTSDNHTFAAYSLKKLEALTGKSVKRLPYSLRIFLENILRHLDQGIATETDVFNILNWNSQSTSQPLIPFMPARVIMQDFAGLPAVVDLVAMRNAVEKAGGNPNLINPVIDTALVIDHSLQVDHFGNQNALQQNMTLEFKRNHERYTLLKWAQQAFTNFKVVPPGMGIIHQVNLEYLAKVVITQTLNGEQVAFPDSVLGTDSHTTMVNSLGVMGWGVGGIEAEAVMLGQPYFMSLPQVIGIKLIGQLKNGVTATDLALFITEHLRKKNVVEKFVEFYGPGVASLSLPDRSTIANMAPEYGATIGFFAVDQETCQYLRQSNRADQVELIEIVCQEQLLFQNNQDADPEYTEVIELDLSQVETSLAGPKRPQDRVALSQMQSRFRQEFNIAADSSMEHGKLAIAAITSCTNTANPYLMIGAGLLAEKAVKKGLSVQPYVKTTLAPGSRVVTAYLQASGLLKSLEKLRFNLVGYGCTTCVGNSGDLFPPLADAIQKDQLIASAVLSGNRNFEGRIHPLIKANYLASPMYVVAYALAGTVNFDFEHDALGDTAQGEKVYLRDIWPHASEIQAIMQKTLTPELYKQCYQNVFAGTDAWQKLEVPAGALYHWPASTYIQYPPFFETPSANHAKDIINARVLALLGDSITTDHISPVGPIPVDSPAGNYLQELGVDAKNLNAYGARRGNHQVMMRGTFANTRLRNQLVPGLEGGITRHHPTGDILDFYTAAMRYQASNTPLIIIAGKEYGTGSARDWAAKGSALLGIKAVIAESYERIHRSNLVGMGILPLQFMPGEGHQVLGLKGTEVFTILGLKNLKPGQALTVTATSTEGCKKCFAVRIRLDTEVEIQYYQNGGILQTVLNNMKDCKKTNPLL